MEERESTTNNDKPTSVEALRPFCIEYNGYRNGDGYGLLSGVLTHRLAWALKHGRMPSKFVLHKCDNPPCINPDHLYDGSHNDNMRDVRERGNNKGTHRGEEHGNNKLTTEQVKDIKRRLANGEKKSSLAREYGVVQPTIKRIADGSTWSWLEVR